MDRHIFQILNQEGASFRARRKSERTTCRSRAATMGVVAATGFLAVACATISMAIPRNAGLANAVQGFVTLATAMTMSAPAMARSLKKTLRSAAFAKS